MGSHNCPFYSPNHYNLESLNGRIVVWKGALIGREEWKNNEEADTLNSHIVEHYHNKYSRKACSMAR